MREKYTDQIAYLFKKDRTDNDLSYHEIGQPFYCNLEVKNKSSLNAMTGTYMSSATEILKTTTQLSFEEHDRIAFVSHPTDDTYYMIIAVELKPFRTRGAKHRRTPLYEYWLTLS